MLVKKLNFMSNNVVVYVNIILQNKYINQIFTSASSFKDQFKNDNLLPVCHRNIQSLTIELLRVKENLLNTVMNDILQTSTWAYNLRSQTDFARSFVNISRFGLNSLCYFVSHV